MSLPWARIDTVSNVSSTSSAARPTTPEHAPPSTSPELLLGTRNGESTPPPLSPLPIATTNHNNISTPTTPPQQQNLLLITPPQSHTSRSKVADPNVFWNDHEEWLKESRAQRPKTVVVTDPQQAPRSLTNPNPPVTYLVVLVPPPSEMVKDGVRRRYSDFDILRTHLLTRFPGILLPSLPEKRIIGGKSESFLVDRQRGLLIFLERVVADPYLLLNDTTRVFLAGNFAEWEMAKKQLSTSPSTPPPPPPPQPSPSTLQSGPIIAIPSEERWKAAVTMSLLPSNHDGELQRAKTSLADMEESLKNVLVVVAKACVAGKQYAATVCDLARVLSPPVDSQHPLSFLSKPMESWSNASVLEPIVMEELLMEALLDEIDILKELRRLVDNRDALGVVADHALRALHKLEVEKEQLDKTGQAEKSIKVMLKIQEAMRNVKTAEYKLEFATKALFYAGLTSHVSTRIRAIGMVFARFATGEMRYGEMIRSVWLGVCSSVGVDINDFNKDEGTRLAMTRLEARAGPKYKGVFLVD